MITTTLANFQTDVIAASHTSPVLLDLGSPRSPASQTLTTLLMRLEADYGGAFSLACANCDLVPQIAQAFQVQSVPTCILLSQGQPLDGFSGGQTEAQVRAFLDKHVQAIAPEPPEFKLLALAKQLAAAQDFPAAIANAKAAVQANPEYSDARLLLAALLLDTQPTLAQVQYDAINAANLSPEQLEQYTLLQTQLAQRLAAIQAALESPEITTLKAAVASNEKDLASRLALGKAYQAQQAYEAALEQFLSIVQTDRSFQDDIGRKAMIEVFALATDTPDVVRAWRQKLSAALN